MVVKWSEGRPPSSEMDSPHATNFSTIVGKLSSPTSSNGHIDFEATTLEKRPFDHVQDLLRLWKEKKFASHPHEADSSLQEVAAEICSLLVKMNSFEALEVFINNLPDLDEFKNESIIRARIHLALHKQDTKTVYELVRNSSFECGEDLIKIWDEALYIDEEKRLKKPLNPLIRFRLRKRHPPPDSICPSGKRKTNSLPTDATVTLKKWLYSHATDPYPSAHEKQELAKLTGLSQAQVKTWFANARRRNKKLEITTGPAFDEALRRRGDFCDPAESSDSSKSYCSVPLYGKQPLVPRYFNQAGSVSLPQNQLGYFPGYLNEHEGYGDGFVKNTSKIADYRSKTSDYVAGKTSEYLGGADPHTPYTSCEGGRYPWHGGNVNAAEVLVDLSTRCSYYHGYHPYHI